jgi:hypothetical protein
LKEQPTLNNLLSLIKPINYFLRKNKYSYMQKISIVLVAILLWATPQLTAQIFPTSNLTIFSEDGNRFFLILNGERQNEVAQTNVRIEELPQPYYNCKIIFESKALNEISKNALMLTDADGIHQDVTYKIKADNKGKQVLRWQSFVPAQQNMIRPSNCTVYRFGNPNQVIFGPGMVETQTTTVVTERNRGNVGGGFALYTRAVELSPRRHWLARQCDFGAQGH